MSTRNYGQACSVSNFLDRFGGRWTLLIIRDLLIGPRRFKDLLAGLPSIGTNLLADRLCQLQEQEIVEKVPDAGKTATFYVLTEKGQAFEPVVIAMARWGLRYLPEDSHDKIARPDLLVVAFRAVFRPEHAKNICETYEFRIDETTFFVEIDDGKLNTGLGTAMRPTFIYITDSDTFDKIVTGAIDSADAQESGLLNLIGDQKAYDRFQRMFNI